MRGQRNPSSNPKPNPNPKPNLCRPNQELAVRIQADLDEAKNRTMADEAEHMFRYLIRVAGGHPTRGKNLTLNLAPTLTLTMNPETSAKS